MTASEAAWKAAHVTAPAKSHVPPDTPAWSPARRRIINRTWCLGTAMVAASVALAVAGRAETFSGQLLDAGVTTVIGAAVTYIGGASGERCVAWLARGRRLEEERR